jgi:predicted small metal-binding protein
MVDHKIVRCACGYRLRARTEQRQVAEVRRHAWEAHGISFSTEEALAALLRLELERGETEPADSGHGRRHDTRKEQE